MGIGSSRAFLENMNKKVCKHHGLPVVSGYFCKKCQEDLDRVNKELTRFFNSPKVANIINEVLTK